MQELPPSEEQPKTDEEKDYVLWTLCQERLVEIGKEKGEFMKKHNMSSLQFKILTREAREKKNNFLLDKERGIVTGNEELDLSDLQESLIDLYDRERQITIDYDKDRKKLFDKK